MPDQLSLFDDKQKSTRSLSLTEQLLEPINVNVGNADARFVDLMPENAFIEFTKHYPVNGNYLGRLLRALEDIRFQDKSISREELSSQLTFPWAMAKSLLSFAQKNGFITSNNKVTLLGNLVLEHDPYFLNIGLLWFTHYLVSSNAAVVIWSRLFDTIFIKDDEFDTNNLKYLLTEIQGIWSDATISLKARDEARTILQSYLEGVFKSLGLVVKIGKSNYAIITDEFSIPNLIWLASILTYRDRYFPGASTLETHLLVDAHFSPGRLFRQKETAVRRILDELHNASLLTVESRLGLDQVRFKNGVTWLSALVRYFQEGR